MIYSANRKTLWLAMLQATVFFTQAQNLILNGSFESNLCNASSAGNAYETLSNNAYDTLMFNSYGFGTSSNIDILQVNSGFCGAAQDGVWYAALTTGGTDAFSFKLASSTIQGCVYALTFYSRKYEIYPGCSVKIGLSNIDTSFGNLIYASAIPVDTCQWTPSAFTFTSPISAQYLTVTCGGPNSTSAGWIHVDNFVLDSGNIASVATHLEDNFKMFPNPVKTTLTITCSMQYATCSMQDALGNILKTLELKNKEEIVDVHDLPNGIYFVNMKTSEGLATKKVIIQH